MSFDEWYEQHEWWHEPKVELEIVWDTLHGFGVQGKAIESVLNTVVDIMRNEYGE